jgi:succinylglutamic semialdehyde dehydrogenase
VSDLLRSISPADPDDEIGRFDVADAHAVDEAVARARRAFPAWRDAGLEARAKILARFAEVAGEARDDLARLIAREVGKALWEARGEAGLIAAKVNATLGAGMALVAPMEPSPGARATVHPRGVLAVLGPFNFPAHLPNGHMVPALATGNTVVFKPSDLAPAVGERMADLWRRAGLPKGVLEIVHGEAESGRLLAAHPGVDAVLFTGSYAVGRAIREATLDQPGKLLALEMGGKNAIVVLADAELDLAVAETALSIAATTGQRCSCASRLFVDRSVIEPPLVSQAAFEKLEQYRGLASGAGGERVLRVDPSLPAPYVGAGLVRFNSLEQTHSYQRDEIFGPEASLYAVDDLDQAIAAVNDSDYGLAASVFTRDRSRYEHAVGRVRTGLLNWNRGTVGASGALPFGGSGRSGNDRPAGITATLYCTTPQSHLESEAAFDPESLPPGMPRP